MRGQLELNTSKNFNKYKQQDELRREFVVLLDTACTEAY